MVRKCVVCGREFVHWSRDYCSDECAKKLRKF